MQVYVRLGIRLLYKVCPADDGRKMMTNDSRSRVHEGGWKVRGVSDLFALVSCIEDCHSAPFTQVNVDQAGDQV